MLQKDNIKHKNIQEREREGEREHELNYFHLIPIAKT